MPDLREIAGEELTWSRAGYLPAAYAIHWNGTEIGTLAWERFFSSRAIARAGDGAWRIRRHGFRQLLIEDARSGDAVATMHLHLFGSGQLEFADGRRLTLHRASLLPLALAFQDQVGSDLVNVRGHWAAIFRGGYCRIEPAGAALPEVALVALLGIYILIRRARRRARR
jgi:hypothetical protein